MASAWSRRLRISLISTSVAAGSYAAFHYSSNTTDGFDSLIGASHGLLRSSRAIYTFTANTLDYKYSLYWHERKSEEYYEVRSLVHFRAANRILKLCEANKGFYIKAGQFIASLQHMPKEYVTTLSTLQDQALPCAFDVVERVLTEEFGENFMDVYKEFDKQPIAAASIAQVHHAFLKDGREVAVKVQYPKLHQQFKIDIATMRILSHAVAWLFPDYQFQWIVPEFEKTSSKELDFLEEANNAEHTARLFKKNESVKVPQILWNMTSQKVLTMEFVHGCKIDDVQALEKAGVNPNKVAQLLVEVFAQMIFVHGYVHGDPHPGNILINCEGLARKGQFQLILLDHGLYRELDESFRSNFCHLWKALILADPVETEKVGERLGAGQYFKYLPVIFLGRTLTSKSGLGEGMSLEERKQLRDEVRLLTLGDVSQFMEGLPRDLLIVLRTDGLIRSIISKLGAKPRMRMLINAKYAIAGLSFNNKERVSAKQVSFINIVKLQLQYVNLRLRLELLDLHYRLKDFYGSFMQIISKSIWMWINNFGLNIL